VNIFQQSFTQPSVSLKIYLSCLTGAESSGRVDYAIIDGLFEEIICITEGKQNQPGKGVAQNLMQCKSSCDLSNEDFYFSLCIRAN
jgi:hypothetical protein